MRSPVRPAISLFIEFVGELIQDEIFKCHEINDLLRRDGVSFRYENNASKLQIELMDLKEVEETLSELNKEEPQDQPHQNIRVLFKRAEDCLSAGDFPGVIHATGSIFETLAKDVLQDPNIDNQSLGGFFQKYRKHSKLPDKVLDFIKDVFDSRNVIPLAGHGSRQNPPQITQQEATTLLEMTKAFIKVEYRFLNTATSKKSS